MTPDPRTLLRAMFAAAVESAAAERTVPPNLPPPPRGRTLVVGAGKAAAAMAAAMERHWSGPLSGLVVTRYRHAVPTTNIEVIEAGHPLPDGASVHGAERIVAAVGGLRSDDLVVCLVSGGASSLLALPAPGLTLDQKRYVSHQLLRSGATIREVNSVRKHLSAIKGGRLAALAHPARVVTLIVSDVAGDDPSVIGSGPTVADPTTCADALEILERYRIDAPDAVTSHLRGGADETPKPGDARLSGGQVHVVANARQALESAAAVARAAGVAPVVLGDAIEGESREVALAHAAIALQVIERNEPAGPPCVLLSGGETTVTMRGHGRGGPNTEYLLALVLALQGRAGIHALAADTDGLDGSGDDAGAFAGPDTLQRAAPLGLDAASMLDSNDSWSYFAALGDLLMTGPTRTNVNDFRAILVALPA